MSETIIRLYKTEQAKKIYNLLSIRNSLKMKISIIKNSKFLKIGDKRGLCFQIHFSLTLSTLYSSILYLTKILVISKEKDP